MKRAGEALSVTLLCLSAVLAWRLGFSLGASDVERHILALISVALEGWKVLLPFVILVAWRERRHTACLMAIVLWPLLTAYSFVGGLGFSEFNRATVAGSRGSSVERAAALKQDIADLSVRLKALAAHRSPAEIEAAIEARRLIMVRVGTDARPLVEATRGCTLALSKRTIDICAEVSGLTQELAQSKERVRVEAQLKAARASLAEYHGLDWAGVGDPQVSVIASTLGIDPARARQALNITFALLLELIGGLGLFFSSLLGAPCRDPARQPVTEATDPAVPVTATTETDAERLRQFLSERTHPEASASIVASRLHADYAIWAHHRGLAPVSLTTFGNLIARQGVAKAKVEGLMRYQGLALNEDREARAS